MSTLSVCIVTFAPDWHRLEETVASLRLAADQAVGQGHLSKVTLALVDNGPGNGAAERLRALLGRAWGAAKHRAWVLLDPGANLGFGRGHNLGLQRLQAGDFHLVLNPDVVMAQDALEQAVVYMDLHPNVGMITPRAVYGDGRRQYLCKRYPTVLDLALRGFAPHRLRARFAARLARHEYRGETEEEPLQGIAIASGCFMFFRRWVLDDVGGFDSRYFLYFEDFDLALRAARVADIAYVPAVSVVHHTRSAARKGLRHVRLFARSAWIFFGTHGWRWM